MTELLVTAILLRMHFERWAPLTKSLMKGMENLYLEPGNPRLETNPKELQPWAPTQLDCVSEKGWGRCEDCTVPLICCCVGCGLYMEWDRYQWQDLNRLNLRDCILVCKPFISVGPQHSLWCANCLVELYGRQVYHGDVFVLDPEIGVRSS
jgi:hypothetical protein